MITKTQREQLRRLAHDLRPLVQIGKAGATPTVITSIDQALTAHELIKVKFVGGDEGRRETAGKIGADLGAELVTVIGNVAILFRQHPEPSRRRVELDS